MLWAMVQSQAPTRWTEWPRESAEIGPQQRLLDRLLGIGSPQELSAVAEESAPITGDQNLEGSVLALRDELGQLLIGQGLEQVGAKRSSRREKARIHTITAWGGPGGGCPRRAEKNGPLGPAWPELVVEAW